MDLMHRYLTPAEAFGSFPRPDEPLQWLRDADQESVLREVAYWLSRFDGTDLLGWKVIEREWVSTTILEPHRTRLLGLLHGDWTLVSPQSLLMVAKRALTSGRPSDLTDTRPLFLAAVAIQGGLGGRDGDEDPVTRRNRLLHEVIRSQAFHRRPDRGMRVAQSQLRWRDIPGREGIDLPVAVTDAFEQVTGVSLLDFQALGFFLFSQALAHPGGVPIVAELADTLHWDRVRLDRALGLASATVDDLATAIRAEEVIYGNEWTFDAVRQFPAVRLHSDRILILSPHLVLERTLGWLPFFDMTKPPGSAPKEIKDLARRADTAFRMICEREVVESLAANVGASRKRGSLFDGRALRAAYPTGEIADAAIAYGDAWVVVEVSSRQLQRGSVVGGQAEALDQDLERGVDEKVGQIEDTIAHLQSDPGRLSGDNRRRRRFVPVLVIAEGLPLNPLTHNVIADRLATNGRLAGPGVEPLHILDVEDLYSTETMAETDRLGLLEILDQHRHAGLLRRVDLRSWLLMEGRMRKSRPERLQASLGPAIDLIVKNLGLERGSDDAA